MNRPTGCARKRSAKIARPFLAVTIWLLITPMTAPAQLLNSQNQPTPEYKAPSEQLPAAASHQTEEIPALVRQQYEGCWRGTFRYPSEFHQLSATPLGGWFSVTYDLCFRWGNGHLPEVTLTKANNSISESESNGIQGYEEPVSVTEIEPSGVIKLHGTARFSQGSVTIVDQNDLVCILVKDGRSLEVERAQLASCSGMPSRGCDGQPWYTAKWQSQFTRVTSESSPTP
jgi:hypothetical protein